MGTAGSLLTATHRRTGELKVQGTLVVVPGKNTLAVMLARSAAVTAANCPVALWGHTT